MTHAMWVSHIAHCYYYYDYYQPRQSPEKTPNHGRHEPREPNDQNRMVCVRVQLYTQFAGQPRWGIWIQRCDLTYMTHSLQISCGFQKKEVFLLDHIQIAAVTRTLLQLVTAHWLTGGRVGALHGM